MLLFIIDSSWWSVVKQTFPIISLPPSYLWHSNYPYNRCISDLNLRLICLRYEYTNAEELFTNQWDLRKKQHRVWHLWAFHSCTFHQQVKHDFFREPPNKHFYQVWFKLTKGFKRRRLITENTHFDTFGSLVSVAYLWSWKKRFTGHEHSHHVLFQLAQWF